MNGLWLLEKLPKSWNDIDIETYKIIIDIEKDIELNYVNKYLELFSLLTDTELDHPDLNNLDEDDFYDLVKALNFMKNPVKNKISKKYDVYSILPFNKLTLGDFIDLEHFISENDIGNLEIICSIIFRQTNTDVWGNIIYEPKVYDIFERSKEFNVLPITFGLSVLNDYMVYRNNFMESNKYLFQNKVEETEENEDENNKLENFSKSKNKNIEESKETLNARDKALKDVEDKKQISLHKWSWENLVWNLANEDITKVESITELPLIQVFNILSMKKSLENIK